MERVGWIAVGGAGAVLLEDKGWAQRVLAAIREVPGCREAGPVGGMDLPDGRRAWCCRVVVAVPDAAGLDEAVAEVVMAAEEAAPAGSAVGWLPAS